MALHDLGSLAPRESASRLRAILARLPDSALALRVDALTEPSNRKFWLGDGPGAVSIDQDAERIGRQHRDNGIVAKGLLARSYSPSQSFDEPASQRIVQQAYDLAATTGDVPLCGKRAHCSSATASLRVPAMRCGLSMP